MNIGYCPLCRTDVTLDGGLCPLHPAVRIATATASVRERYYRNARRCLCPQSDRCYGDRRGDVCTPQFDAATAAIALHHRGVIYNVAEGPWQYH